MFFKVYSKFLLSALNIGVISFPRQNKTLTKVPNLVNAKNCTIKRKVIMDIKQIIVGVVGFLVGVILTGLVATKFVVASYHQFSIGKLSDNVTFYRQIESGNSDNVAQNIKLSLEFFIVSAEEFQESMWVSPRPFDIEVLNKAKALQAEFQLQQDQSKEIDITK